MLSGKHGNERKLQKQMNKNERILCLLIEIINLGFGNFNYNENFNYRFFSKRFKFVSLLLVFAVAGFYTLHLLKILVVSDCLLRDIKKFV